MLGWELIVYYRAARSGSVAAFLRIANVFAVTVVFTTFGLACVAHSAEAPSDAKSVASILQIELRDFLLEHDGIVRGQLRADQDLLLSATSNSAVVFSALSPSQIQKMLEVEREVVRLTQKARYREARALLARLMPLAEDADLLSENNKVLAVYTKLISGLSILVGDFAAAIQYNERCVVVYDRVFGGRSSFGGLCLEEAALIKQVQVQFDEALSLLWRAYNMYSSHEGPNSYAAVSALNSIGGALIRCGRLAEAVRILETAYSKSLGRSDFDSISFIVVGNLASAYALLGEYKQSFDLTAAELALAKRLNTSQSSSYWRLGYLYRATGNCPAGVNAYRRSISLLDPKFDLLSFTRASLYLQVAYGLICTKEYGEAERALLSAIEYFAAGERVIGRNFSAEPRALLSFVRMQQGRLPEAETLALQAVEETQQALNDWSEVIVEQLTPLNQANESVLESPRDYLLAVLARAKETSQQREVVVRAAFLVSQWKWSRANASLQRAIVRAQSGTLRNLLATREELSVRLLQLDTQAAGALRQGASGQEALRNIETERSAVRGELATVAGRIRREFPNYFSLISISTLAEADARNLLGDDEALLVLTDGQNESYLTSVRRSGSDFTRIALGRDALRRLTRALSLGLDASAEAHAAFDNSAAHELYRLILGGSGELLSGVENVVIVPEGPFEGLSFAALRLRMPQDAAPGNEGDDQWLVDRFAISYLPRVASLRVIRERPRAASHREPFIGFGAPALTGKVRRPLQSTVYVRGEVSASALRDLSPLPGAEQEIKKIAAILGGVKDGVFVGLDATEQNVKQLSASGRLGGARVVAFATHALVAGDSAVAEPGLVLTPPSTVTGGDDGFLKASEAATLSVNADWVVLTGCNTAAPDGTPEGRPLSGLARAFMHAGGRSLLVSTSAVHDSATEAVVTHLFQEWASTGVGKAQSLRNAMRKVRSDSRFSHPQFWASWMLVGDARH